METPEARVARGAAWLDEKSPGWERKIDLSTLDVSHPFGNCVVCQATEA